MVERQFEAYVAHTKNVTTVTAHTSRPAQFLLLGDSFQANINMSSPTPVAIVLSYS